MYIIIEKQTNSQRTKSLKEKTLGSLLETARKEKGINKSILCRGLCTLTAYSRYEQDKRIPDKFLANALLERLGINPFRYEFVTSNIEFKYSILREKIEFLIWKKDFEKISKMINTYQKIEKPLGKLHKQYILFLQAYISLHTQAKDNTEDIFKSALKITECDEAIKGEQMLFTDIEMKICYYYAEYLYHNGKQDYAYTLFNILNNYFTKIQWDNVKREKYYPNIIFHLAQQEFDSYNFGNALHYLQTSEKIMKNSYKIDGLYKILELKNKFENFKIEPEEINFRKALEIINISKSGKITEEGIKIWENTINQQS